LLLASLSVAAPAAAGAEARDPLQWSEVAACRAERERALCILRVVSAHDAGSAVLAEPALQSRPDLLARIGVDPAVTAKREAEEAARVARSAAAFRETIGMQEADPFTPIRRAIRLDEFDTAAKLLDQAPKAAWIDARIAAAAEAAPKLRRLNRATSIQAGSNLRSAIRDARRAGDTARAEQLEQQLALLSEVPTPTLLSREQAKQEAEAELLGLGVRLATAAGKTRPDIARPLADRLFRDALQHDDSPAVRAVMRDAASLARHTTPTLAATWAEALEVRTAADHRRGDDTDERLADRLRTTVDVWSALETPERIDALVQRWTPQAQAAPAGAVAEALARIRLRQDRHAEAESFGVLTPRDFLVDDILRGRVHARLSDHLRRVRTPAERRRVLRTCAGQQTQPAVALQCLEDLEQVSTSVDQRREVAGLFLEKAADAPEPNAAALLTRALQIGSQIPDGTGLFAGLISERPSLVRAAARDVVASERR
jgi:hypothetical protein